MAVQKRIRPRASLKAWRDAQQWTQREAAEFLEVSQPMYCRMEQGELYPGRLSAHRISLRTGVPLETLLGVA